MREGLDAELAAKRLEIREREKTELADIAECLGVVLFETLRVAIFAATNPVVDSEENRLRRDTGNLREGWRNLANKLYDYVEG